MSVKDHFQLTVNVNRLKISATTCFCHVIFDASEYTYTVRDNKCETGEVTNKKMRCDRKTLQPPIM